MQAKMDAIAPIIGFLVNGAGLATLYLLLDTPDLKKLKADLSGAIANKHAATYDYVKDRREKLGAELRSLLMLSFHLINAVIDATLILVLLVGPERLFLKIGIPSLAIPLTGTKIILLVSWLVISVLVYLARAVKPTVELISLFRKAGKWMRENQPKKPGVRKP
jgi:hypothetical protein